MSTRYDIQDTKDDWVKHNSAHHCGELTKCPERSKLWRIYQDTAGRHGFDEANGETYDNRQRRQYNERVKTGSAT